MKRIVAVVITIVVLFVFSTSVLASSIDDLKTTFSLGPFQVSEIGIIKSRTDTEVDTIMARYGLLSLEDIGITDALIDSVGIEQLDEITAHFLAEGMVAQGLNAEVYKNSHDVYGVFYTTDIEGDTGDLLTMMMVHGKDCMMVVMTYDSVITPLPSYAQYVMDNYSLVEREEK